MSEVEIAYIDVGGRSIAYRLRPGNVPTILFLPGYVSDMEGAKALALDALAECRGLAMLRLDYSGTGSSGGRFEDGSLSLWLEEALAAVDQLTDGPLILVGSSMGGWIALHLALLRPERVRALVGIAAAPDFTDWGFSPEQKAALQRDGRLEEPNPYGPEPTPTHPGFWRDGEANLLLDAPIPIHGPVRLLHGQQDPDVPWDISLRLAAALRSADVQVTLIKDGDHRLSRDGDIALLLRTVDDLHAGLAARNAPPLEGL